MAGRSGRFTLRRDLARWPDGLEGEFSYLEGPSATVIVPVFPDATTVLVGQWRHAWGGHSWELPAGTIEEGEEPLACARRELEEEAGLQADSWDSLGTARGTAAGTMRFHLFLARDLTRVERAPEAYEQDLTLRELSLRDALEAVADGTIQHAASALAVVRAARYTGLL